MSSKEEIINIALSELGADMVLLAEEQTENARIMTARFPDVLDTVLRAHPWNCAMARREVSSDGEPVFGWGFQYPMPVNPYCLRVWRINDTRSCPGGEPYTVEGRKILTDAASPIRLRFIKRADLSELDALTVQAIALRLAAPLAYRIPQSRSLSKDLWDRYKDTLSQARSIDAQEGTPEEPEGSDFLRSRL